MALEASQERQAAQSLRGAYRELINKARNEKHNLVSTKENALTEIVNEANALHNSIQKPREQAVDSELFALVTESGVEYVRKLTSGARTHTLGDLLRRLRSRFAPLLDGQEAVEEDPSAFRWGQLGAEAAHMFCTCPTITPMLGPLNAQPRVKRTHAHRRTVVGPAVRPDEVAELVDQEAQETDQQMSEIWSLLQSSPGSVPLLELVLNHDSFAETVENLFTLSFLVRDHRAALQKDGRGGILVAPREIDKARATPDPPRVQFVMDYSMAQWREWNQVIPREACLCKPRQRHATPLLDPGSSTHAALDPGTSTSLTGGIEGAVMPGVAVALPKRARSGAEGAGAVDGEAPAQRTSTLPQRKQRARIT